jgi:hypothetical protein
MDRAPKGVPAMCCSVCPLAGVAWAAVTRHSVVFGALQYDRILLPKLWTLYPSGKKDGRDTRTMQ